MNITTLPINSLSKSDIDLLNKCVWRDHKFFIKMTPHTINVDDHIVYHCNVGRQKRNDVMLTVKAFRYSELLKLYTYLITAYKLADALPKFPAKHWWGNTYKSVVEERIKSFDDILHAITTIPALDNDITICDFFNIDSLTKNANNPLICEW